MLARSTVAVVVTTLVAALLPVVPAQAASPAEEPRFVLVARHKGRGEGFSFESTTTTTYRLCDIWDGGQWGVAPAGPGAGPSVLDELGITTSAGAGLPGQQAAATPRALFAARRSLLGLQVGESLPFCIERAHASGSDGRGSTSSSVTDETGAFRQSGVVRDPNPMPFSKSSPSNGDPGQYAQASLRRTARGARLSVSPGNGESAEASDIGIIDVGSLELDEAQRRILGGFDLTEQELSDLSRLSRSATVSGKSDVGHLTITMHLTVEQPDLGEVTVEAEEYDTWRPLGDLRSPGEPGAHLTARAWVHRTGDPEARSDQRVKLTFELKGVSALQGVCNNAPASGADFEEDLRFLQDRNPGVKVEGRAKATSRGPVGEARVTVSSFDFGAWGRLLVTAEDGKGRKVPVTVKGREGKVGAALPIPKDEDENRIADVWDEAHGTLGKTSTSDDDDLPTGNGFHGDGLTLFEEYRGFQRRGAWMEGDPIKKDLFVCDKSGFAAEGIVLFEAASELAVHTVTCEELSTSRIINRYGEGGPHLVRQHGLRIEKGGGSPINEGDEFGPPRTSRRILLPSAPGGEGRARQEMVSNVAHELAHGVGVQHHGDGLFPVLYRWVKDGERWHLTTQGLDGDSDTPAAKLGFVKDSRPAPIQVLRESDRSALKVGQPPPPGFAWLPHLGGYAGYETPPGGVTSGDDACLVRYEEKGTYFTSEASSVRWIPDGKDWRPRTTLCGGPAGTGVNAAGRAPQPRTGDATRGNCKGQIVVNDRYLVPKEGPTERLPGTTALPQPGR